MNNKETKELEELIENAMPPSQDELVSISAGATTSKTYGLYKQEEVSRIYQLNQDLKPSKFIIEGSHSQVKRTMEEITFINK